MQLWKLPTISIAPEVLIDKVFGFFDLTNTFLCTWIAIILLFLLCFFGTRRRDMIPSGVQNFFELIVEFLLNFTEGISGKKAKKFFPWVISFFLFIVICNLLDVLPGVDTIGSIDSARLDPHSPPVAGFLLFGGSSNALTTWLRPPTTDLNLTLALALVSFVMTQFYGFYYLGAGEQISKYLNFRALFKGGLGLIDFFVGILETVSELGRLISFSFRLFGNVFAGSVLLAVFAFLLPAIANVVFIPLELFVGVIQAFVFAFLTLLFMEVGTSSHNPEAHATEGEEIEGGLTPAH